jgi:mevalonate kinase
MARASGKVILLGEHAVVYGGPALAVGLDLGAVAHATAAPETSLTLNGVAVAEEHRAELLRALTALLERLGAPALAVTARLELPPGAGLGASAALGVSIARAALAVTKPELDLASPSAKELVRAGADAWERVFHGNPSGIDAAAAAEGGCIRYSRADGVTRVRVARALPLVIAVAGPPASTREMVASVARLFERRPELVTKTVSGITSLVENARLCLEVGDLPGLGKLMDLNQMLLSGLMLSTEGIERACAAARGAGALGAKLTGAGGGGAVVALADLDPEPVLSAFRREGLPCFVAHVAGEPRIEIRGRVAP